MDFTAYLETSFKYGKKERETKITKNLIKLGLDNEIIDKAIGLTHEQIDKLRTEI
ncbi:MAG: hypothetical protein MUE81_15795 [Thermoflexibacter sp.]|nr:hypothetical protein [Thermoflexibacter sp.]